MMVFPGDSNVLCCFVAIHRLEVSPHHITKKSFIQRILMVQSKTVNESVPLNKE